jgi:uncharacterized membrane protein YdbT with pleckstrin-like domain
MSYVRKVLQPGETVIATGKFHWIIYLQAASFVLSGIVLFFILTLSSARNVVSNETGFSGRGFAALVLLAFLVLASISFVRAWFIQWTTELAITDRRVIYKTGFIKRITAEMNMDKVETVNVDQPVLGRLLNYGTIHIRGTGTGIEHLHRISSPLELRTAVTAK